MSDIGILLGLAFGLIGLLLIGLSIYGVRIPKAFESEANWYAINAYGGRVLAIAGGVLLALGVSLVAFPPTSALTISLASFSPVPIVLLALVPILRYAKRLQ